MTVPAHRTATTTMQRWARWAGATALVVAVGAGPLTVASAAPSTPAPSIAPMAAAAAPAGRLTTLVTLAHDLTTRRIPYSHGGHGPTPAPLGASVDCSGLVRQLYWAAFGFDIGRGSGDSMVRLSGHFTKVASPIPGDVALFGHGGRAPAYHAMIYVGTDGSGNPVGVGSPDFGQFIKYQQPNSSYWGRDLMGYWRFNGVTPADSQQAESPPADGDFIVAEGRGEIYRLVGGAPVYVSSWAAVGGQQPVRTVSAAFFDALPTVPADGTLIAAAGRIYRIAGGAPTYVSSWAAIGGVQPFVTVDGAAVDNAGAGGVWSHLRAVPADGTFVAAGGRVYRIAGGAPTYVSSWSAVGGPHHTTVIDPEAVAQAGHGAQWRHLRLHPADGTFVVADGRVYRMAGGAPVYVSNWAAVGGTAPWTVIDPAAVAGAGQGGEWRHLRLNPADGTVVAAGGRVYVMAGGAPTYVSNWAAIGGPAPYTVIDPAAVEAAGNGNQWRHLRLHPADGTFLSAGGHLFRTAGGAPIYVSSWATVGGMQPFTVIDAAAEANAGGNDVWRHLRLYPQDGTFLAADGHAYRVQGGVPTYVPAWAPFGGPQPYTVMDPFALAAAGPVGPYRHLLPVG